MKVTLHRDFEKSFRKLPPAIKTKAIQRLKQFAKNPSTPYLRDHALRASYKGYRSINITGDYRAVYRLIADQEAIFTHIGTHSELYR